jgi:hypothetical protein
MQNGRGLIEFQAMQINLEVVLEIWKRAWSAKRIDMWIWNHTSNMTNTYKNSR